MMSQTITPIPEATEGASSNVRWKVMSLCLLVSMVTYLDRVNISIAARYIISENGLSNVQMGEIFSAFTLSYAIFQVPGGWLADRFGSRLVLTVAVLWWSAFTALTALTREIIPASLMSALAALLLVRFCLGAGEAAAWPTFNRTIANWIPIKDRALASSIPLAGGGAGAAIAPPFIAWLMLTYGWRESFYVCAAIGAVCALAWFWYMRDDPADHKDVNAAELRKIQSDSSKVRQAELQTGSAAPWRAIFSARNVWLLAFSSMSCGYLIYIYLSWFYVYLTEVRGMTL